MQCQHYLSSHGRRAVTVQTLSYGMQVMQMQIITTRYETIHRRKPRGYRLWYFQMPDGLTFSYAGTYARAKQAATVQAMRRCRHNQVAIQVCA